MRLDSFEKHALQNALRRVEGDVYLFGSRLDDEKRGGDIDLLVFSEQDAYELSKQVAVTFFMHCEEKIDVIVFNPNQLTKEQKAFFNSIEKVRIQ
ncbi:nucleotidyltransferase domain-containing protein [bacterium]|nr:nucleotidyltransferase domain-containing protein [bacterium]